MKYAAHVEGVIYAIGDTAEDAIRNAKVEVQGTVEAYDHEAAERDLTPFQADPIGDDGAKAVERDGFNGNTDSFEIIDGFVVLNV